MGKRNTPRTQNASGARKNRKARGVGKRAGLSRDAILDSALLVVQGQGLDKLTVRRLAQEAGVSPMAVYHYFDDKEEIILGVIDRVVADAAVTEHGVDPADWQDWLLATFHGIYRTLVLQPGVIPMLANSLLYGPAALGVLDEVMKILRSAGFDAQTTARGFHALVSYTVGAAQLQAGAAGKGAALFDASRESTEAFEHLVENSGDLLALAASDPFAHGFRLFLAGLVVADA